jgi:hypothetical protein
MTDEDDEKRAARLGRLVDEAIAGAPPPALLDVEERALLETATEIHGTIHGRLPTGRRKALVDAAFAELGAPVVTAPPPARKRPQVAWAICGVFAVAAAILLVFGRTATTTGAPLDGVTRSDRLVGPISADAVEDARTRLDTIYADRLAQHRAALLAEKTP